MRAFLLLLLLPGLALAAGVTVVYDPANPDVGPFPSDVLTVADTAQPNGLRVQMPLPDCSQQPSTCGELNLINQFDGFALNPRMRVRFSGPVNVDTLKPGLQVRGANGQVIGVNQIVYDPQTNTAYAQPDQILLQSQRYALVVTDAVKDTQGDAVQADPSFTRCLSASDAYCTALRAVVPSNARGASLFTTMTATRLLEQIAGNGPIVRVCRGDFSSPPVTSPHPCRKPLYPLQSLNSIIWRQQTTTGNQVTDSPLPSPQLLSLLGFGAIAIDSFASPNLLDAMQVMPVTAAVPPGTNSVIRLAQINFYVLTPRTAPPANGYPVVLAGHGIFDNVFGAPLSLAVTLLNRGFAVVTFSPVGHGYGPQSTLAFTDSKGNTKEVTFAGRAVDIDGDGKYDNAEGCIVIRPGLPINIRDCLRQTAIDYTMLTNLIRDGVDLDGDGRPDLDGSRISFVGQSLGSFYGTMAAAVDPNIQSAILNAAGGSATGTGRISQSFRPLVTLYLGTRQPALLNKTFDFDDNFPLRDQPVRVNNVPGALDIQETLARVEWIETPGAPYAYAPLLKQSGKPVLFQMGLGDQTVPNPSTSQLIHAAGGENMTSLYRHDFARARMPQLPANPHTFLVNLDDPAYLVALTAQEQVARFLLSGQPVVPDVNALIVPYFGVPLFETPATLPETLSFQQ